MNIGINTMKKYVILSSLVILSCFLLYSQESFYKELKRVPLSNIQKMQKQVDEIMSNHSPEEINKEVLKEKYLKTGDTRIAYLISKNFSREECELIFEDRFNKLSPAYQRSQIIHYSFFSSKDSIFHEKVLTRIKNGIKDAFPQSKKVVLNGQEMVSIKHVPDKISRVECLMEWIKVYSKICSNIEEFSKVRPHLKDERLIACYDKIAIKNSF